MNLTKANSVQEILETYPEAAKILREHGIDVEDECLYSVRHLPIEECVDFCGIKGLEELIDKLNRSSTDALTGQTIGELVAQEPLRAAVFDEFGLDFCCGGKRTLEEACRKSNVDLTSVLQRLADNTDMDGSSSEQWTSSSVSELIDHIEGTHHAYLKTELPRLSKLSEKVARVHGEKEPDMVELMQVFRHLRQEIEQHTLKEEMVLFPYIRQLESQKRLQSPPFGTVANPIRCMESEHEDAGQALARMRELTGDYVAPPDACGSWKALVGGLKALDQDLRIHIHKENSILFPKALLLESEVILA